ncbi:cytochrome P450 [Actinocorallia longicatena]|uniref:Cytochrome P450 n=1 Tax=Actinocorallia longicatena TaxID=111803 RepID=A0ABP6QPD0_9ACTN
MTDDTPVKLYDARFAADPRAVYEELRARHGGYAPAELAPGVPATVVLGYDAALDVLKDPLTFRKDPRGWQKTAAPGCPMLPALGYRASALFSDGPVHSRLRKTITDSFDRVDVFALRDRVERSADELIDRFCADGEADLSAQYGARLPLMVFTQLFGCPPEIGDRFLRSMILMGDLSDAEQAASMFTGASRDLIALKRSQPGADITSWLIAHPAGLTDEELTEQIGLLIGKGASPVCYLIGNALRLLLSDARFADDLSNGSLPVEDALDEVLWTDPPIPNMGVTYTDHEVEREGHLIPPDQPVVISFAAANTDPAKQTDHRVGNRSHLAFGAGPHTCPARNHARVMASSAIEKLLDRLPDLHLSVPPASLTWHPGPFHRALTSLPVSFTPAPTLPKPATPPASPPLHVPEPSTPPAPSLARRLLQAVRRLL